MEMLFIFTTAQLKLCGKNKIKFDENTVNVEKGIPIDRWNHNTRNETSNFCVTFYS